jgi:hypothetical protein
MSTARVVTGWKPLVLTSNNILKSLGIQELGLYSLERIKSTY